MGERPVSKLIASWFGTGLLVRLVRNSDSGAGTVGALFALVLALWLGNLGWGAQLGAAIVVTGLSVWASQRMVSDHAQDPGWIVVDEAAGTFVATIGVGVVPALIGFGVFRVADITKSFPLVRQAERLAGGWGITADDVVAGLWGLGAAWLAQWWIG